MKTKAEYKSAQRSRDLIRKALVRLMQEKDVNKITITDIVRAANINRGTFYAHYSDVYALLDQIENELMNKLLELLEVYQSNGLLRNPLPVLQEFSRFLESDLDFYRMLSASKSAGPFLAKLKAVFIEKLMNDERALLKAKDKELFLVKISFFAGGIVEVYLDWLQGKIDKSLDEVAVIVSALSP